VYFGLHLQRNFLSKCQKVKNIHPLYLENGCEYGGKILLVKLSDGVIYHSNMAAKMFPVIEPQLKTWVVKYARRPNFLPDSHDVHICVILVEGTLQLLLVF